MVQPFSAFKYRFVNPWKKEVDNDKWKCWKVRHIHIDPFLYLWKFEFYNFERYIHTFFRYTYLSLTRCQTLIKSCQSQADNEVGKSIQILNCITNFKRFNLQHISIFCWESLSLFTNLSGNRFEFKSLASSNNESRGVHKK